MSEPFMLGSRKLIPLKEAYKVVPYTKEYIARLAREGKIAAAQINRQWYIEEESLKNFFINAQLEIEARTEYTRALRREELDLQEWWQRFVESQEHYDSDNNSGLRKTIVFIILGLFVAMVITNFNFYARVDVLAAVLANSQPAAGFSAVSEYPQVQSEKVRANEAVVADEFNTIEMVNEEWPLDRGIVLYRASTTDPAAITDFFSDPVTVIKEGPNSGRIVDDHTGHSLPFVKIPPHTDINIEP